MEGLTCSVAWCMTWTVLNASLSSLWRLSLLDVPLGSNGSRRASIRVRRIWLLKYQAARSGAHADLSSMLIIGHGIFKHPQYATDTSENYMVEFSSH